MTNPARIYITGIINKKGSIFNAVTSFVRKYMSELPEAFKASRHQMRV